MSDPGRVQPRVVASAAVDCDRPISRVLRAARPYSAESTTQPTFALSKASIGDRLRAVWPVSLHPRRDLSLSGCAATAARPNAGGGDSHPGAAGGQSPYVAGKRDCASIVNATNPTERRAIGLHQHPAHPPTPQKAHMPKMQFIVHSIRENSFSGKRGFVQEVVMTLIDAESQPDCALTSMVEFAMPKGSPEATAYPLEKVAKQTIEMGVSDIREFAGKLRIRSGKILRVVTPGKA